MMNELQRANKFYRTLIHTAMDGFWMTDAQGQFLEVNDIYCQMIGYSRDELLTMTISDVEAMETPEDTAHHIRQIQLQDYDRFETRHQRKDGHLLDIEVSSHFVQDGGDSRFLVFLRDITERKRLQIKELERVAAQRDVLVREVHHRIKNNLQGVAALLRQQVEESPEAGAALKKAIARVRAVAVVHGLKGEANSQVALCDMVRAISLDLQELTPLQLHLETAPHHLPVLLTETEMVP